jgi:hypothetical protein
VGAVAISPDGTWLASASDRLLASARDRVLARASGSWDGSVRIWDTATGRARAVMRVESPLSACAWDLSGQVLAVAGGGGLYLFTFNP